MMLNIQMEKKKGEKKLYTCGFCFTFTDSLVKGDIKGSNLMEVVLELYLPVLAT
jgi:hypothetical protein